MRNWSFKVGTFFGIAVYVHATFLILVAWIAFLHWSRGESLLGTLEGILFILLIFVCVVLHEYGHALTARRYGVRTRDIILLPIGGVARLESIPEEPRQELWVAVAGPAVNVVIAMVLGGYLFLTDSWQPLTQLGVARGAMIERLAITNVLLVVFNLIPAFPMDGGRVLRALLAMQMPYHKATRAAARVGQGLALLFGFLGLFSNPFLLFIALFVWVGAEQEARMAEARSALAEIRVRQVMMTDFEVLFPDDALARAIELTLKGTQKDFPVVLEGRPIGILSQATLLSGLAESKDPNTPVSELMSREIVTVDPEQPAHEVFSKIRSAPARLVVAARDGRLVGLVTLENVVEYISIRSALEA